MKEQNYPGIKQGADDASQRSQRYYTRLFLANLLIGIVAALITIYNFEQDEPKIYIYIVTLVLLIANLALTVLIKYLKFEEIWYQARAVAESVKTLTWRYSTCSENFESNRTLHEVDTNFKNAIQAIKDQFPELLAFINSDYLAIALITQRMTDLRNLTWKKRLDIYITDRIDDQINWYSKKAGFNKKNKIRWLSIIILCQTFSVVSCIFLIIFPKSAWNLVGFFTTMAASAVAWLELKQYQSLIQAYNTACTELNLIRTIGDSINSELEFTQFVLDSENAISREHTMWLAQRRK